MNMSVSQFLYGLDFILTDHWSMFSCFCPIILYNNKNVNKLWCINDCKVYILLFGRVYIDFFNDLFVSVDFLCFGLWSVFHKDHYIW